MALCLHTRLLWWCSQGAYPIFTFEAPAGAQVPVHLLGIIWDLDMPGLLCVLHGICHSRYLWSIWWRYSDGTVEARRGK